MPAEDGRDLAWQLACEGYSAQDEGRREALFALGNGLLVVRAASVHPGPDGSHYPGTYRAGLYDRTEAVVQGERDATDTLVNLPNWLPLDLRIEDGPWFRLEPAHLLSYVHRLDLRTGTTVREFTARDPAGRTTRLREHRLVNMANAGLASLRLEITPLDWSGRIELRGALDGAVCNTNVARYADYRHQHLADHQARPLAPDAGLLQVRTAVSQVEVATALRLRLQPPPERAFPFAPQGLALVQELHARAKRGRTLAVEKVVAICAAGPGDAAAPAAEAEALLARAGDHAVLERAHVRRWRRLWSLARMELADADTARCLRLHAFHLLQTAGAHPAAADCGIPARGWHGEAYHGHVFWDEAFVLPFFHLRFPAVARAALLYRYRRLDAARALARAAGLRGAMYPWRSAADGSEQTPRFQKNMLDGRWMPDHTRLQRHVGSAIALNVWRYWQATGDLEFLCDHGAEMVLEIARFWGSLAQPAADGRFAIRGVIGPDEYHNSYPGRASPGLDNNAYTNVMAAWTLSCARDALDLLPAQHRARLQERLALGPAELAHWDRVSRRLVVPFHGDRILSQFEGFEQLQPFDRARLPPQWREARVDWALHAMGESADAYQVTKQADALTLFYLLSEDQVFGLLARMGYDFGPADLVRTARYYMERTTHRSSLSRVVYAGALARAAPELSWQLYRQALGTDVHVLPGEQVAEGIHLAAMGGTLDTLQRRYLGLATGPQGLELHPALPPGLGPVQLTLRYRGQRLELASDGRGVRLRSLPGNRRELPVRCAGCDVQLAPGQLLELPGAPD